MINTGKNKIWDFTNVPTQNKYLSIKNGILVLLSKEIEAKLK
jgi:hypothetical protein